jgi:NADP-dependent 3-hydroxy acid dehydrogenase YdfG
LAQRVAIVTGASAGIGRAIARDLACAGARVVINARRESNLKAAANEINQWCSREAIACVVGDCAEQATIDAMFERASGEFGARADLVVVNAGRGLSGSVATSDPAAWEDMVRTNWLGAARLMRCAAECLANAGERRAPADLVVIGSNVGRHVSPFSSMYGSTKFAVHALAEGLRREVGPKGVRVTVIAPGFVKSEFQGVAGYDPQWVEGVFERIGPVLEPEDVARVVTFVAQQPPHVHINDIMIRPTRQDYP